jgi:hypothetical protein
VPDNGGDHSGGGGSAGGYADNVFSTYVYTGDGTARSIVNGVDLDGEGGLVWFKNREDSRPHSLFDTETDPTGQYYLISNTSNALNNTGAPQLTYNSDGFTIADGMQWNANGNDMVSWTFRKAPSFFDVVTISPVNQGGGTQTFSHNLGVKPGMMMVKQTDGDGNWSVYHKAKGYQYRGLLNMEAAFTGPNAVDYFGAEPTDTEFTLGADWGYADREAVVYLFAHDDSEEGMIQCGSYTGTGAAGNEIDLGWEPQWVMIKGVSAGTADSWWMFDTMRGIPSRPEKSIALLANTNGAELSGNDVGANLLEVTATGFNANGSSSATNGSGKEYIYMAIRRPNKPAEEFEPEELFGIDTRGSTSPNPPYFTSGFPVDMAMYRPISSVIDNAMGSRLQGPNKLLTSSNAAEGGAAAYEYDFNTGWFNQSSVNSDYYSWMWRRAHGFFDVVTYEGTGVAGLQVPHSLGVKPEMMWVKCKNGNGDWAVYSDSVALDGKLNSVATFGFRLFNEPTDEVFEIKNGPDNDLNAGRTVFHIAYLFASVPGICDIGTYTGTGSNVVVDCGFGAAIPRFVMVKRTDGNGNWMYTDFPAGLNRTLALNTTDAQKDKRFSYTSGAFTVLPVTTDGDTWNPSIDGAEYIYMAIA